MTAPSANDATLALVHEGWNHLMSQRPLAAWGSWQRALRLDPSSAAARQALQTLESAPDLPLAARKIYRFRKPESEAQRARWDRRLRNGDASELHSAAQLFGQLVLDAPDDVDAWFNQALCLAWAGHDREAIDCLDQVTRLEAESHPKAALEAWTLAEILRQGGGAENLSDDLRYACTFRWEPDWTERLLALFPELRRIPAPRDPTRGKSPQSELDVLEWLDRPFPAVGDVHSEEDLAHVLATVYITPVLLRLSSPRVETLELAEEKLRRLVGTEIEPLQRVAAPLPLPFLDADVWTTRLPEGLDRDLAHSLTRETVEAYYENEWIHRPRQGLDGLSPLAASQDARRGDAIARVKLEAVIRVREQLGLRSSAVAMYQGYPFDRLRRRLGLDLDCASAVDPHDLSCASLPELQDLEPEDLDDTRLVEAFKSAAGFRDDQLTARFAAELANRDPASQQKLDITGLFAPLVRQAMQRGNPAEALDWLDRARTLSTQATRPTFDTWRAEILARTGRPDEASRIYESLIAFDSPTAPQVALDAALTLLDNGFATQAKGFLERACDVARAMPDSWVLELASRHLQSLSSNEVESGSRLS